MKKILLLLLIFISIAGCEKNDTVKNTDPGLTGKWAWISTCGGMGTTETECYTPKSTQISKYLVFTTDSIYNCYINDTLRLYSTFHSYFSVTQDGMYTLNFIDYDSIPTGPDWYMIRHDTLTMRNTEGFALWTNQYIRVN